MPDGKKKAPTLAERYLQGLRRKYGIPEPKPITPYVTEEERVAKERAPEGALGWTLDIAQRPFRAVAGGIRAAKRGESILGGIGKGFTGESRFDTSEVIGAQPGVQSLAIDIITDPLTFVSFGTGKVIKGGAQGLAYKLSRSGEKALAKDATKIAKQVERVWRRSSAAKAGAKRPAMAMIDYSRRQAKNVLIDAIEKREDWALKYLAKPGTKISIPGVRDIIGEPRVFGGLDVPVAKTIAAPFKWATKIIGKTPQAQAISKAFRGITTQGRFGKIFRELPTEHQVRFNYMTKDFVNEVKDLSDLMYKQGRALGKSKADARAFVSKQLLQAIETESVDVIRKTIKPDLKAQAKAQANLAKATIKAKALQRRVTKLNVEQLKKSKAQIIADRIQFKQSKPNPPTKKSISDDIMMDVLPMAEDAKKAMKDEILSRPASETISLVMSKGIRPGDYPRRDLIARGIPRHLIRNKGMHIDDLAGLAMTDMLIPADDVAGGSEAFLEYLAKYFSLRRQGRGKPLQAYIDEIISPEQLAEEVATRLKTAKTSYADDIKAYSKINRATKRELRTIQHKLAQAKRATKTLAEYEKSLPALREAFEQSKRAVVTEARLEPAIRSADISTLSPQMREIVEKHKAITDKLFTAEHMLPPTSEHGYVDAYIAHMVTKDGKKFLREKDLIGAQKAVATEFSAKLGNLKHRGLPGTVTEINDYIREGILKGKIQTARKMSAQELADFKFFQEDPVEILLQRGVQSVKVQSNAHFINDTMFFFSRGKVAKPTAKKGVSALELEETTRLANDEIKGLIRGLPGKPEGYTTFESLDGKWIHVLDTDIANDIGKWTSFTDKDAKGLLRTIDQVTAWWKATATGMRPAFHLRNLASNIFNAWLGGTISPTPYLKAMWIQRRVPTVLKIGGREVSGEEILQVARQHGVMGTNFMHHEAYMGEIGARKLLEGPKLSDWVKLNDMQKFPPSRAGKVVGESIEDTSKLAVFIDRLIKGDSVREAADHAHKYLFNYLDLTHFERNTMRRWFPFYTWTRKNLPLQLGSLIKQPGKFAAIAHTKAAIEGTVSGDIPKEELPDFIREQFGIRVKKENGAIRYFLLGGWLPAADISNLEIKTLLEMLHPGAKAAIEWSMNKSVFLDKDIERYPGELGSFLGWELSRKTINFWRNIVMLNEIDRIFFRDPNQSTINNLLNTMVKTFPIDPARAKKSYYFKLGEMIEQYGKTIATGKKFLSQQTLEDIQRKMEEVKQKRKRIKAEAQEMEPTFLRRTKKTEHEKEINRIIQKLLR